MSGGVADITKVGVVGLGPIGRSCAHAIRTERYMRLGALIDIDPEVRGKTLTDLCGDTVPERAERQASENESADEGGADAGPLVTDSLDAAAGCDVVIVATGSRFETVAPTVIELLERGVSVVSSCEQMLWPRFRHPALAERVDAAAKRSGRIAIGTGVNPGFAMDALAVMLSGTVRRAKKIRCVRRLDAAMRRKPLQRKVGAGLTPDQFRDRAADGRLGHAGLAESAAMLAAGLGYTVTPEAVREKIEPVIADRPLEYAFGMIPPGRVTGLHQTLTWAAPSTDVAASPFKIELDLTMAVGAENPLDKIKIEGPVGVCLKIPGALPGDSATIAVLINHARAASRVAAYHPGLRTMIDTPIAGCRGFGAGP